ncbi:antigen WC1.1 [Clupea harengus]|uniref:Antigen WC1.1 n=1 Tax=Clupea harengus TaxID=7950 RepID=A0A6P8G8S8_CLUHA|nr:antigen WC1.1 [Clupea harengus]
MELLTAAILLQMLDASQAALIFSVQWNTTESPTKGPNGNHTELGQFSLSNPCAGVLRTRSRSHANVPVDLSLTNRSAVAGHICRHLGCGEVYEVRQHTTADSSTCVTDCVYEDPGKLNCTEAKPGTCLNVTEIYCDPPGPAIRLANGTDPCEGRVEVWNHTDWGSVCDDGWDVKAGDVVCAQLDCGSAHKVTGEGGPFPSGSGHILLDELNCTGSEKDLWQCVTPRTGQTHDCGHKEDAGVVCTGFT